MRIFGADGKIKGAGFRVSGRLLFTCAHVVADALGIPRDTRDAPAGEVVLDFPNCAAGGELRSKVVHWSPLDPSDAGRGESDIAVLELLADAPEASQEAPLVTVKDFWDRPCGALGFPHGHDRGVWAAGILRDEQADGWVQIDGAQEYGSFIAQGFSGTLVWDTRADGVVGMVVAVERVTKDRTAYMIPSAILAGVYPGLGREVRRTPRESRLLRLEPPDASIDPRSPFYIRRPSNATARGIVERQGTTTTIKGPGQMGKSALLADMIQRAVELGKSVAFVNLQQFDEKTLADADVFFPQFCWWAADRLGLAAGKWTDTNPVAGNVMRASLLFQKNVLEAVSSPVMLAIEEMDRVFGAPFRKDFFSMLRSWHEGRAMNDVWRKLDLVLVTSTEPYRFNDGLSQSPFVGEVIELEDFTYEEARELNARHDSPLASEEVTRLVDLVGGHPYLVRSALYQVAVGDFTPAALFARAATDEGPFAQHLGYHYLRLYDEAELAVGLRQVINQKVCRDERVRVRLLGAGLARVVGNAVEPRSPLYAEYFKRRLHV